MHTCRKIVFWFGDFLSFLASALPGAQLKQSKGRSTEEEKPWPLVGESGRKGGRRKGERRKKEERWILQLSWHILLQAGIESWRAAPRMKTRCNCCPLLLRSWCFRSSGEEGGWRNPTFSRSHQDVSCPIGMNWHSSIPWDLWTRSILEEAVRGRKGPMPELGPPQRSAPVGIVQDHRTELQTLWFCKFWFCKCSPEKQEDPSQENIPTTSGVLSENTKERGNYAVM